MLAAIVTALIAGANIATLDLALNLALRGQSGSFGLSQLGGALLAGLAAVVCWLALVVVLPLGALCRLHGAALRVAVAHVLVVFLALCSVGGQFAAGVPIGPAGKLLFLAAYAVPALLFVGPTVYLLHQRLCRVPLVTRSMSLLAILLPMALLGAAWQSWDFPAREEPGVPQGTPAPGAPRHVILITVDTLRADAVSCYNPGGNATPHIDSLARDGARFTDVVTPSSWTVPSVVSILTGLNPAAHGALKGGQEIPLAVTTLAEYFGAHGYHTIGVGMNNALTAARNHGQGFHDLYWPEMYTTSPVPATTLAGKLLNRLDDVRFSREEPEVSTEELVGQALARLEAYQDKPLFLWLHVYDPHAPYRPPHEFLPDPTGYDLTHAGLAQAFDQSDAVRAGVYVPNGDERRWIHQLYEAEARHADAQLGRLFARLQENGLYDDALILLTSDHGEEFWEHDGFEHGHALWEEVLRVPLIVKPPGGAGRTVQGRVSVASTAATLLDYCGIAPATALAPSLRGAVQGTPVSPRPVLVSGMLFYEDEEGLYFGHQKYMYDLASGTKRMFDLETDPDERNPLGATPEAEAVLQRLKLEYAAQRAELGLPSDAVPEGLSPEARELLEGMGYL